MVNPLCFEVRPSKEGRCVVLPCIEVKCQKCGRVIKAGRFLYPNGLCYRCEHKRVLREAHYLEGRNRKLDRQFRETVLDK